MAVLLILWDRVLSTSLVREDTKQGWGTPQPPMVGLAEKLQKLYLNQNMTHFHRIVHTISASHFRILSQKPCVCKYIIGAVVDH